MRYTRFLGLKDKIHKAHLKGMKAQMALAPKDRQHLTKDFLNHKAHRPAAVLALFYPNAKGETCFLLTLRAQYKGTHSAQISFPGGKFDPQDTSLQNTALREAHEETGIEQSDVTIVKALTKIYIPPSKFLVSPFLATIDYEPTFKSNHEVKEIIAVKLDSFLDDRSISKTTVRTSISKTVETPCFILNNHIVWGATAMMLNEIRELIKEL